MNQDSNSCLYEETYSSELKESPKLVRSKKVARFAANIFEMHPNINKGEILLGKSNKPNEKIHFDMDKEKQTWWITKVQK